MVSECHSIKSNAVLLLTKKPSKPSYSKPLFYQMNKSDMKILSTDNLIDGIHDVVYISFIQACQTDTSSLQEIDMMISDQ